jgi:hypothetical protein
MNHGRKLKGYYTVEATFVVSICVWILVALCYSGLYLHDNLLLESETCEQTMAWLSDGGKKKEIWQKNVKKRLQKKLFLMRVSAVKAESGLTDEIVSVTYKLPISWKKLKQMLTGNKQTLTCQVSTVRACAANYKWDYDVVKD